MMNALLHAFALPALATLGGETAPFLNLSYDDALALAARENKIVMVEFATSSCASCQKLEGFTWPDPEVQTWLFRNAVSVKINPKKNKELEARHRVNACPSILFLASDGTEFDRLTGYVEADQFINSGRWILASKQDRQSLQRAVEAHPQDPGAVMALADHSAGNKQYPVAMKLYFQLFDQASDTSFQSIRRGELLSRIAHLARLHTPASTELMKRRSDAVAALERDPTALDAAFDLAAINAATQRTPDSLKFFQELAEKGASTRVARLALLDTVFDQLVGSRQYDSIHALQPDLMSMLNDAIVAFGSLEREFHQHPMSANLLGTRRGEITARGSMYFEVLVAGSQLDDARKIADRLIEFDPTSRTFLALARRTQRTGRFDVALEQVERGLQVLPPEKRKVLEPFAASLRRRIDASK